MLQAAKETQETEYDIEHDLTLLIRSYFLVLWSIYDVCVMVCRVLMDTPERSVNVALLDLMERR